MKKLPISLAALLVVMMPVVGTAGRTYQITQITLDALNHESPSINNLGDVVWSQQVGGFWQVYIRHFGSSTAVALPGQAPDHNNQYPDIDDAGDVMYLKDGVGQGVARAVILNHGGTENIVEFSSFNNLTGDHRDAGQHFGIAGNGTTISYYDFFQFGSGVRRFNVSGVGALQCGGGACDFSGNDFPDINSDGTFVFASAGTIFSAPISAPNSRTIIASGGKPRIADVIPPATTPEIVYINGSGQVVSTIGGMIDAGSWADVNNPGSVVYEKAAGGFNQIFLATGCQANKPCITNPQDGASPQSQFVAITGTGKPGAMLDVLLNGSSVGTVSVDSEGNWEALPEIQTFGTPAVSIQVQDRATSDMSNTISVNKAIGPFVPPPPVPASFLALRHGDILISSSPTSREIILYGPTWTHSAIFLGGDANGTPRVAEAVITSHFTSACTNTSSFQCGITRVVTLEGSDLWPGTSRIAAFTTRNQQLTAAQRGGIVSYASGKSGLPYWSYTQTFGPLLGAHLLWLFGQSGTQRYMNLLNQMNVNKNLDTAFECASLVWRAYFEGTSHTLDLDNPNNMTAQPGSIFGTFLGQNFLEDIRPSWVVPETFATSPQLQQIF